MIQRAIVAALLAGLASPVLAGQLGPAYDQAAGLAAGKSADATYDGGPARAAVQAQVAGAVQAGGLAVETPSAATAPSALRPALTADVVPPAPEPSKGKFLTVHGVLFGVGGAAVGAGVGWVLGGPIGAALGALAGFAIGFLLSKLLR